jgi:hypothetical protein
MRRCSPFWVLFVSLAARINFFGSQLFESLVEFTSRPVESRIELAATSRDIDIESSCILGIGAVAETESGK